MLLEIPGIDKTTLHQAAVISAVLTLASPAAGAAGVSAGSDMLNFDKFVLNCRLEIEYQR